MLKISENGLGCFLSHTTTGHNLTQICKQTNKCQKPTEKKPTQKSNQPIKQNLLVENTGSARFEEIIKNHFPNQKLY